MKALSLRDLSDTADSVENAIVAIRVAGGLTPALANNLKQLVRLELLTDEVIWAILAQAPIDPLGVYGAMKHMGVWALSVSDFTMVQVLAKVGATPVAAMRIDLMSDDMTFVVWEAQQLVLRSTLSAGEIEEILRKPGTTENTVLSCIDKHMRQAVTLGTRNYERANPQR